MENNNTVDGIKYSSYASMQAALKEKNNIDVIRQRLDFSDGNAIYQLYEKMIERKMFTSINGICFLYELRHRLVTEFGYNEEELSDIEFASVSVDDRVKDIKQTVSDDKILKLENTNKKLVITVVALVAMIVAMFIIAALNPNVGYINTENKILNKYSAWEEDLTKRETAVEEKEEELGIDNSQDTKE